MPAVHSADGCTGFFVPENAAEHLVPFLLSHVLMKAVGPALDVGGGDSHLGTVRRGLGRPFPGTGGAGSLAPLGQSQKFQKSGTWALTVLGVAAYIRLTNDGGDAAGDDEVRF